MHHHNKPVILNERFFFKLIFSQLLTLQLVSQNTNVKHAFRHKFHGRCSCFSAQKIPMLRVRAPCYETQRSATVRCDNRTIWSVYNFDRLAAVMRREVKDTYKWTKLVSRNTLPWYNKACTPQLISCISCLHCSQDLTLEGAVFPAPIVYAGERGRVINGFLAFARVASAVCEL